MTTAPKGRFTFRFAAVCFGLSAAWELLILDSEVLLLGQITGGAAAAVYHLVYTALFAWLALSLWTGRQSGYYTLIATTILYTLDRLQVFLARDMLISMIRQELGGREDLMQMVGVDFLLQAFTGTIIVMLLCWWGFVGYAYYRREYFGISTSK